MIICVLGHVNLEGNEVADEMVRIRAATPLVETEPFCGLIDIHFQEEIRNAAEVKISQLWKDTGGLRQAKELLGDFDCGRSRVCKSLFKRNLRLMTGFRTGHCVLKGQLSKLETVD